MRASERTVSGLPLLMRMTIYKQCAGSWWVLKKPTVEECDVMRELECERNEHRAGTASAAANVAI